MFDILRRHHREHGRDVDGDWVPGDYTEGIYDEIKALPPVIPTRKNGKWIRVDRNKVKCSECEITHLIAQYPHGAIDFCPNCGAEMESEE